MKTIPGFTILGSAIAAALDRMRSGVAAWTRLQASRQLVVLRDRVLPMSEIRRMADIKLDFLLEFGELLSIMPMSLDEFHDNSASFINSIRRDGIAL